MTNANLAYTFVSIIEVGLAKYRYSYYSNYIGRQIGVDEKKITAANQ